MGPREALDRFRRQSARSMQVPSLAIIPLLVIPLVGGLAPTVESRRSQPA